MPITYSVCCVFFVESADTLYNPTHFVIYCTRRKALFYKDSVERGTRGELHHTQTPALDRSAVWNKYLILFHEIGSLRDFYIMTLFANCKVIMRTTIARILCTVNSLPMIISEGFSGRKKNTCQKHFSLMKSTTFKHAKCKFNFVFCPLRIKV